MKTLCAIAGADSWCFLTRTLLSKRACLLAVSVCVRLLSSFGAPVFRVQAAKMAYVADFSFVSDPARLLGSPSGSRLPVADEDATRSDFDNMLGTGKRLQFSLPCVNDVGGRLTALGYLLYALFSGLRR